MVVHDPNVEIKWGAQMAGIETYKRLSEEPPNLVLCRGSKAHEDSVKGVLCRGTGVHFHFILFWF